MIEIDAHFEQVVFPRGLSKKPDATNTWDRLITRPYSSSTSSKEINFFGYLI